MSELLKKYESIDQSKLNEATIKILNRVKTITADFTADDEKNNKIAEQVLNEVMKKNPDSVKIVKRTPKAKATPKKIHKATHTPKVKQTTSSTAKSSNNIMSVAKEIQKSGESWKDAMERAKQVLKERKEQVVQKQKTELEKLFALVKTKKELQGFAKSDIQRDAVRDAKPRGARVVTKQGSTSNQYGTFSNKLGRKYWETRDRHADRLAPNYPKDMPLLASGGAVNDAPFSVEVFKTKLRFDNELTSSSKGDFPTFAKAKEFAIDMIDNGNYYAYINSKSGYLWGVSSNGVEQFADGGMTNLTMQNVSFAKGGSVKEVSKISDFMKYLSSISNDNAKTSNRDVNKISEFMKFLSSMSNENKELKSLTLKIQDDLRGVIKSLNSKEKISKEKISSIQDDLRDVIKSTESGSFANGGSVKKVPAYAKKRLEELREEIREERISTGEIAELESLKKYIDPSDVELLQWAGVSEFEEDEDDYAKGGKITKSEVMRNMYKPSGDYFFEQKGNDLIVHLTSKDASNSIDNLMDKYDVKDNGRGYHGSSYILSRKNKLANGGSLPFMTDPNFGNFQNTGAFAKGGSVKKVPAYAKRRLEELRKEIREERISTGEIAELESLKQYIDPSDVELLQWAGVPEFEEEEEEYTDFSQYDTIAYNLSEEDAVKLANEQSEKDPNSQIVLAFTGNGFNVYVKKDSYELGGAFMMTDLAGHTGGSDGVGSPKPLSGVSGTYYTGLVGETGAMSSGELFENGGGVEEWKKGVTIKIDTRQEAEKGKKLLKEYWGKSGRNFKVEKRDDKYVITYEFYLTDKMELGGVMAQNQQVINDASQSYVNYYLGEGASQGIYKDGGSIPNNYAGRTPEDIWNSLSKQQRGHFLYDHVSEIEEYKNIEKLPSSEIIKAYNSEWSSLDKDIKNRFTNHTREGQYASGGSLGKALYVAYSSYFDSNKYDEEKIMSALKSIGAKNIHLENDGGMSNQPEVVVFNGSKRQAEDALNEAFDTNYILIYEKDWRTKKMADGGSVGDDFEEVIDLGSEQYYTRPYGIVQSESNGEVELVAVATIKDLEDYMSEDELPEEGNFQLDITLVPTEEFISEQMLESANDEDSSVSDDSVVNIVNYAGGLNYSPQERVFFESHQDALDYLMSDELKEQINRDSFSSDYIMYKQYNRAGQTNSEYLDYLMGVTDRFAKGGFVGTVEFNAGDIVWQKDEKRYATVMNNYGDPINGDGGEIRLDTTGNTMIFTYDPKTYENTGYNLVKLGEKGDTGKFTPEVVAEMKESANRLIDSRKERDDTEMIEYYEGIYKRLLDGEFDSMTGAKATASNKKGSRDYTYVPNKDVKELSVVVKGELKKLMGSDILDGVYVKNSAKSTAKVDANAVFAKMLKDAKEAKSGKTKMFTATDLKKLNLEMVQKLVEAGYTEQQVRNVIFGYAFDNQIVADNELEYDKGIFSYEDTYVKSKIEGLVEAQKKKEFAVGIEYPDFDWQGIIKKYKISSKPKDVIQKSKGTSGSTENFYEVFVGENIVIGHAYGYKWLDANGKVVSNYMEEAKKVSDPTKQNAWQKEREQRAGFNGGYWYVASSKIEIVDDVLKTLLSQKGGYCKEISFYDESFTTALKEKKIAFADGGEMESTDISADLEKFNIDNLDYYEYEQYNHFLPRLGKAQSLQLLINTVDGDVSQLSPELAKLAEKQGSSYAKGGMVVYLDGEKSKSFKTKKSLYEFVRSQTGTGVKKVEIDYGNRIYPTFDTYEIVDGKLIHKGEFFQKNYDKEEAEKRRLETERSLNQMMGYANGGSFTDYMNSPQYKELIEKQKRLYAQLKSRVVRAVGIDEAIKFFDYEHSSIAPYRFLERAVQGNLIALDEINEELVKSALEETKELDSDEDLEEIGGSDFTYYLKNVLDGAGFKVGFVNSRLRRLNEDGSVKEIENSYADGGNLMGVHDGTAFMQNPVYAEKGSYLQDNEGFMRADNEFNYRYPEKEVYIETLDEPIDLTSTVTVKSNEVIISPINENIDLNDDNRVRARMTQSNRGSAENFGKINPRAFEFIDLPMPTSNTHKND